MAEAKTATVKIGDMQVEIAELSFKDSLAVDSLIPMMEIIDKRTGKPTSVPSAIAMGKIYALATVRKIDGELLFPCGGPVQFERVAQRFTANEAFELMGAVDSAFGENTVGEELKNGSTELASVK
jgi:hypothetical protein